MSKSDNFENRLLLLLFNATAFAGLAEDHSSPVALELSLHTASPGEAGDQATTEATYTGYARITAARTSGVWEVTGNQVENVGALAWPECTAGSNEISHWAVGLVGDDEILYYGSLTNSRIIDAGEVPTFPAGTLTIDED